MKKIPAGMTSATAAAAPGGAVARASGMAEGIAQCLPFVGFFMQYQPTKMQPPTLRRHAAAEM